VVDVKITRSVDLLSDTAVIKLPTKFVFKDTNQTQSTEDVINISDPVTITLSYKGKFTHTEFKGFVTHIKPNTPIEIHCEDAIYDIRQKSHFKSFENTTLREVLNFIVKDTPVQLSNDVPEVKFDKFLLKNVNGAQALEKIKNEYGLSIFLNDEGKLYAGLRQAEGKGNEVDYDLEYNIVKHDLQFKKAEQVKIKLKAKGWKSNNTYVEVEVGDSDGEQRVWQTHSITDKATLKRIAESKLKEMKYDGYEGTVTGFLIPFADRSMTAHILDERYPEREGKYFIPKVVITFGTRGARRKVTLGKKVSA
jgi:hypothetical protein